MPVCTLQRKRTVAELSDDTQPTFTVVNSRWLLNNKKERKYGQFYEIWCCAIEKYRTIKLIHVWVSLEFSFSVGGGKIE